MTQIGHFVLSLPTGCPFSSDFSNIGPDIDQIYMKASPVSSKDKHKILDSGVICVPFGDVSLVLLVVTYPTFLDPCPAGN